MDRPRTTQSRNRPATLKLRSPQADADALRLAILHLFSIPNVSDQPRLSLTRPLVTAGQTSGPMSSSPSSARMYLKRLVRPAVPHVRGRSVSEGPATPASHASGCSSGMGGNAAWNAAFTRLTLSTPTSFTQELGRFQTRSARLTTSSRSRRQTRLDTCGARFALPTGCATGKPIRRPTKGEFRCTKPCVVSSKSEMRISRRGDPLNHAPVGACPPRRRRPED